MIQLDPSAIVQYLVVALIGGFVGWIFKSILKLQKDMDSCFHKIRALEDAKPNFKNADGSTD